MKTIDYSLKNNTDCLASLATGDEYIISKKVIYESAFLKIINCQISVGYDMIQTNPPIRKNALHLRFMMSGSPIEELIDQQTVIYKPNFLYLLVHGTGSLIQTTYYPGLNYNYLDFIINKEIVSPMVNQQYLEKMIHKQGFLELPLNFEILQLLHEVKASKGADLSEDFLRLSNIFYLLSKIQINKKVDHTKNSSNTYKQNELHTFSEVKSYIQSQYANFPTIDFLAKKFALNACKLKKGFKEIFGLGLFEFANQVRMEKATELLIAKEFSIKEIAFQLGYATAAAFSTAFKRTYGFSPNQVKP